MNVSIIPVSSLSIEDYKKYSKLNLGDKGLMKFYLKSAFDKEESRLKYRRNETIYSISIEGIVQSWALVLDYRLCCGCKWRKSIHIYTRSTSRGKGYARNIIRKVLDTTAPERIYCRGNTAFFGRYNITYAP